MDYLPMHWSILTVDIEGSSDLDWHDRVRVAVCAGLCRVLQESFHAAGLPWLPEVYKGQGDGAIVLVSPLVLEVLLIAPAATSNSLPSPLWCRTALARRTPIRSVPFRSANCPLSHQASPAVEPYQPPGGESADDRHPHLWTHIYQLSRAG